MEVVAAPAEGAEESRRGGGEGATTDGVRKRDVGWAWMVVEDGSLEVVTTTAEGPEEVRRGGGGGVTD